jgi:hypothetical protein
LLTVEIRCRFKGIFSSCFLRLRLHKWVKYTPLRRVQPHLRHSTRQPQGTRRCTPSKGTPHSIACPFTTPTLTQHTKHMQHAQSTPSTTPEEAMAACHHTHARGFIASIQSGTSQPDSFMTFARVCNIGWKKGGGQGGGRGARRGGDMCHDEATVGCVRVCVFVCVRVCVCSRSARAPMRPEEESTQHNTSSLHYKCPSAHRTHTTAHTSHASWQTMPCTHAPCPAPCKG